MNTERIYNEQGVFVGAYKSSEWYLHVAINRAADARADGDPEEIAEAERDLAELEDSLPEAAERIRKAHPRRPVLALVTADTVSKYQPRTLLTTEDYAARAAEGAGYLIKGLLYRNSYVEIFGAPGSGKTFAALSMAYAVAQGREWMGHRVKAGLVVYVPYEGAGGLTKRVQALAQTYGHAPNFRVIKNPGYNLRELSGRQALGRDLAQLPEKPALIIFDTLARALAMFGGDENSAQDLGVFNQAVAALIEATGACVAVIHHSGKDKSKGGRGSSALLGAVDTDLQVDGGQVISRKQRDVDLAPAIGFKLVPVNVGVDEDGEPTYSCVVEPGAVTKPQKLTGHAREAFTVLCELSPNNEPVSAGEWRDAFARKAWATDPPKADGIRAAFRRAVTVLRDAGRVVDTPAGWQRPLEGGDE